MAKKSRKKVSKNASYLLFAAALFAVVTFVMMFLSAVVYKSDYTDPSYVAGSALAFGKTLNSIDFGVLGKGDTKINFSFLAVLAYLLPLVLALAALICFALGKKSKMLKLVFGVVLAAGFIASVVILIKICDVTSISTSALVLGNNVKPDASTFAEMGYTMAYGTIIAIVSSSLGAVASVGYALVK